MPNEDLVKLILELLDVLEDMMPADQEAAKRVAQKAAELKERLRAATRGSRSSSSSSSSSSSERRPPSSEGGSGSFSGSSGGVPVAKSFAESAEIQYHQDLAREFLSRAAQKPSEFSKWFDLSQQHTALATRLSKAESAKATKDDVRELVSYALRARHEDKGLSGEAAAIARKRKHGGN